MFCGENGGSIEPLCEILPPTWAYGDTLWVPQCGATGLEIHTIQQKKSIHFGCLI